MSFAEDIADDFDLFDNVQLVTWRAKQTNNSFVNYTSVKALRRAINTAPSGATGKVFPKKARWHLKASSLAVVPKYGDLLVEADGTTWTAEVVATQTFGTRYAIDMTRAVS